MKNVILLLVLVSLFYSCEKPELILEPYIDANVIENYIHDSEGIVFNIVHDIDSFRNYNIGNIEITRFHNNDHVSLKYGQKVNWTYNWETYPLNFKCWILDAFPMTALEFDTSTSIFILSDTIKISLSDVIENF